MSELHMANIPHWLPQPLPDRAVTVLLLLGFNGPSKTWLSGLSLAVDVDLDELEVLWLGGWEVSLCGGAPEGGRSLPTWESNIRSHTANQTGT